MQLEIGEGCEREVAPETVFREAVGGDGAEPILETGGHEVLKGLPATPHRRRVRTLVTGLEVGLHLEVREFFSLLFGLQIRAGLEVLHGTLARFDTPHGSARGSALCEDLD